MASRALAACICFSSSVVLASCERVASVNFEEAEVEQHVQQDLVRRENQSQKGYDISARLVGVLNSMLPVFTPGVTAPGSVEPLIVDSEMTGYPGTIEITQGAEPNVGCASTYQDEEGYATGIVLADTTLHVDVKFNDFDLSSLLDSKPYLKPLSRFLKLDGMLRAKIHIPLQRIGFELDTDLSWTTFMDEEDTQHIDVEATGFIPRDPPHVPLVLKTFAQEIPGWMPGFDGKPQNFLDWITKTPKIGVWPMIAKKVCTKVEEKSLAKLGNLGRTVILHATNNFVSRRFFSLASYVGIGATDCMGLASSQSYRGGQSVSAESAAAEATAK